MKTKIGVFILSVTLLLSGCSRKESQASFPLVTGITVRYENGPIHGELFYNEDDKMQLILTYLRLLKPYGEPPEDPENAEGTLFEIVLTHADGGLTTYQQKADKYLKTQEEPWLCIPSQKAMELSVLLGYLEEDVTAASKVLYHKSTEG